MAAPSLPPRKVQGLQGQEAGLQAAGFTFWGPNRTPGLNPSTLPEGSWLRNLPGVFKAGFLPWLGPAPLAGVRQERSSHAHTQL